MAPVAEMIEDLTTVFRYDQRGCGRSSGGLPWTLDQAIDDMEALRRDWNISQWVVMGHSFGASLALAYGLRFPHRVRGIGYISGTGIDPAWHDAYHREKRQRFTKEEFAELQRRKQQYQQASGSERHRYFRAYAERLWASDVADHSRAVEFLASMLDSPWLPNEDANRMLGLEIDQFIESPLIHDRLQRLAVPVWILHGASDPRSHMYAQHLADILPQSQFVALAACGHLPWIEQPDLFRASIRHFLAAL